MRKKFSHTIRQPFSHVHKTLVALGFKAVQIGESVAYRLTFRTFSSSLAYPIYVPVRMEENGQTEVYLARAYFENENETPEFVKTAARCMLNEAADYLDQFKRNIREPDEVYNSMAPDEPEMARLGKQMKHMKTNSELLEDGLIPDPVQ